jgi:hypothetical protein
MLPWAAALLEPDAEPLEPDAELDAPDELPEDDELPHAASSADSEPAAASPPAPRARAARRVKRGTSMSLRPLIVDISCCHIANGCGGFYHRNGAAAIIHVYKMG